MERLTYDFCFNGSHSNQVKGADNLVCSEVCEREGSCKECPIARAFDRLAAIEDILGDDYDLDRLRELIQADREGRCFVFLVPPDRNSEDADVVICDDGEEYLQRVYEADVGRNSAGEMNCIYLTNGGPDFETADIGKTVFLPHETDKIEAALAKMRAEGCE